MKKTLIHNATIVNENEQFIGSVLIEGDKIAKIYCGDAPKMGDGESIDATGMLLLPGVIDDHVHFREPGLTDKEDFSSGSRAAVAGGVTSFMDMPNVNPPTISLEAMEQRMTLAAQKSVANYSFYLAATNDNIDELLRADYSKICGVKLFLGSSTGNMLVDRAEMLQRVFTEVPALVAVHSEDEDIIKSNTKRIQAEHGEGASAELHPQVRSEEACYKSTQFAVDLAKKHNTRLHVLHLSTGKELGLFDSNLDITQKRITAEACPHYLWFDKGDYQTLGARIKCNPAIKTATDKAALRKALTDGSIDVVGTDHAPHLITDKQGGCFTATSGIPMVQHSLVSMLELSKEGILPLERIVELMCHNPSRLYNIEQRGFIREGYFADLVLIKDDSWQVERINIASRAGWSPFEGKVFSHKVKKTFVNGHLVYNDGLFDESTKGKSLSFKKVE